MKRILIAWLGTIDIKKAKECLPAGAATKPAKGTSGPLRTLTDERYFDVLYLLYTCGQSKAEKQTRAEDAHLVAEHVKTGSCNRDMRVEPIRTSLADPSDHTQVYDALAEVLPKCRSDFPNAKFTLHLTPGTPAMHAVMLAISKQWFEAEVVRTVEEQHAEGRNQIFTVQFPMGLLGEVAGSTAMRNAENNFNPALESRELQRLLGKIAPEHKVNILLLGETGVGKSYIAERIHKCSGRKGEMISINCAGLTESIVESELFGHEKGAFTGASTVKKGVFEQAHGSTLFLDEIGELPLMLQAKLLRVIQESKVRRVGSNEEIAVDVRLVCATNINLMDAMAHGAFRPDLYHRIAHYEVRLRPFREYAPHDKEHMIAHLLAEIPKMLTRRSLPYVLEEGGEAMRLLCAHYWPGNVRQIMSALLRLCLSEDGNTLQASTVARYLHTLGSPVFGNTGKQSALSLCAQCAEQALAEGMPLDNLLTSVKQRAIELALEKAQHKKTTAAKLLGVPVQKLNYALDKTCSQNSDGRLD